MAEKSTAQLLIDKEKKQFLRRLERELVKMADEGIEYSLPALVIDHVANIERNICFVKSIVKRYAREGVKEGEGLKLFKIRTVRVPTEEQGRPIIRTEIMVIAQCELSEAYHSKYRKLNQTVSTRLRIGVYTFDTRGCKYPDRTLCSLPVDVQQIRDHLRINTAIVNPVYIDVKESRSRQENRPHINKVRGGYPIERVMGIADLPTYNPTTKTQCILSTPERPSDPLIEEKNTTTKSMVTKSKQGNQRLKR